MLNKIVTAIVILVGTLTVIYTIMFFIQETSTFYTWQSSGVIGSEFGLSKDSTVIFSDIDSSDYVSSVIPDSGDVVIAMDSSHASLEYVRKNIYKGFPPGKEMTLTYIQNSDTLTTTMKTKPIKRSDMWQDVPISLLRLLIALGYCIVGIWAFVKRPNVGAVHALSLFCFAMAVLMINAVHIGRDNIEGISVPYYHFFSYTMGNISAFFGAFWLNLQLLFPKPGKFITRHPYWAYAACYGPLLLLVIFELTIGHAHIELILIPIIMVQVWAGFIILFRNYRKATDPLEKRQTRLVLWGTGTGLLGIFMLFAIAIVARAWFISLGGKIIMASISLVFLGLLASPVSFAYAFGRYRLLEVEGRIRRGTRFAVITIGLLLVFYFAIYGISELTLDTLGIESRGPVLLIAFLLAIGFTPAQRKIQAFAERRIFPERNRLRDMLRNFLGQASSYANKTAFWTDLENHLKEILGVSDVYPVLYHQDDNRFYPWESNLPAPFDPDGQFVKELAQVKTCPLMLDEARHSNHLELTPDENAWLDNHKVALVLPLKARSNLVGFIGLGYKSEQEDFNAEDCGILMSLASQVAVAGENIQLLEENIEKNRLEKELGMARRVQQGLLPSKVPSTPGLEIAARSKFCLEVAGDYYDIINIDNHRTVVAIGDVSGKGAAAALMMSNIQASFRTAVGMGGDTSDNQIANIVGRINDLIHRNTPPDQFITFFVGFCDPTNKSFAYVNAGHNPPFIVHKNGEIEMLEKGGLLLGAMANMPYEQATVPIEEGDMIFLYTDGVSEAENVSDDMFGEDRIIKLMIDSRDLAPDDILAKLDREVKEFIGDIPLSDDFTTLVMKVKS